MFYTHVCLYSAHRGRKRVLDLLELELQTVVNCSIGAGNQTPVIWKIASAITVELSLRHPLLTEEKSVFIPLDSKGCISVAHNVLDSKKTFKVITAFFENAKYKFYLFLYYIWFVDTEILHYSFPSKTITLPSFVACKSKIVMTLLSWIQVDRSCCKTWGIPNTPWHQAYMYCMYPGIQLLH